MGARPPNNEMLAHGGSSPHWLMPRLFSLWAQERVEALAAPALCRPMLAAPRRLCNIAACRERVKQRLSSLAPREGSDEGYLRASACPLHPIPRPRAELYPQV